jgi:hypothetical protein
MGFHGRDWGVFTYAVVGVVVAVWLGLLAWALGLAEPRRQPRERATVASTWQPPVAPA